VLNTESGSLVMSAVNGAGSLLPTNTANTYTIAGPFGSSAAGDVVGPAASVDSEIALFSSTTGKLLKRATVTGLLKATAGVLASAVAGTDYYAPGGTDVAVGDGGTGVSSFTAYAPIFGGTTSGGALQAGALGTAGQVLTSNGPGAIATFQAPSATLTVEDVAGATYTFVAGDAGKAKRFTNAGGCTATIPAALGTGWNCLWERSAAAGSLTFAASGTTLAAANGSGSLVASLGRSGAIIYEAADIYQISGDLGTTGTGSNVHATSPTLVTPVLGVATATTINKVTITAPAAGATLTLADGKTIVVSSTLTFTGTDGSTVAFGAGGAVGYSDKATALTKNWRATPFALTDGANIATDASERNNFKVTLGGNRTLDNPTNLSDGMTLLWRIKQDGTGSRTLAYGNKFTWGDAGAPTLSTGANKVDIISGYYDSTDDKIHAAIAKGF